MRIKPLFDRVLLKSIKLKENSTSCILLPETVNEKSEISVVEEIGTGGIIDGNKVEWNVKKGDQVIYNKYSAHEFHIDGEDYVLISQQDILAIVDTDRRTDNE